MSDDKPDVCLLCKGRLGEKAWRHSCVEDARRRLDDLTARVEALEDALGERYPEIWTTTMLEWKP